MIRIGKAALKLEVHPETLVRWCNSGTIRFSRDNHGVRWFREADLEKMRKQMRPRSVPDGGKVRP